MLAYIIGLIVLLSEKIGKMEFVNKIIKELIPLKPKVSLWFYQLSGGMYNLLLEVTCGIRNWQKIR